MNEWWYIQNIPKRGYNKVKNNIVKMAKGFTSEFIRGGRMWRRCRVSYATGAPMAYSWARLAILIAGKGTGVCFHFFCFFPFIPVALSSLSVSFVSSTISPISYLPFSGRRHKMTHNGWRVVTPQQNQSVTYEKVGIIQDSVSTGKIEIRR